VKTTLNAVHQLWMWSVATLRYSYYSSNITILCQQLHS